MAPANHSPRMRTSRLLNSLHSVLSVSRSYGASVSIAYVDVNGRTRFLWREHDAVVGSLLQAEAMAWTVIARSMPDKSLTELLRERVASLTQNGFCEGRHMPSLDPVEGGTSLTVDNNIVGAVGIAGELSVAICTRLGLAAIEGYLELDTRIPPLQTCHFAETKTGDL